MPYLFNICVCLCLLRMCKCVSWCILCVIVCVRMCVHHDALICTFVCLGHSGGQCFGDYSFNLFFCAGAFACVFLGECVCVCVCVSVYVHAQCWTFTTVACVPACLSEGEEEKAFNSCLSAWVITAQMISLIHSNQAAGAGREKMEV